MWVFRLTSEMERRASYEGWHCLKDGILLLSRNLMTLRPTMSHLVRLLVNIMPLLLIINLFFLLLSSSHIHLSLSLVKARVFKCQPSRAITVREPAQRNSNNVSPIFFFPSHDNHTRPLGLRHERSNQQPRNRQRLSRKPSATEGREILQGRLLECRV